MFAYFPDQEVYYLLFTCTERISSLPRLPHFSRSIRRRRPYCYLHQSDLCLSEAPLCQPTNQPCMFNQASRTPSATAMPSPILTRTQYRTQSYPFAYTYTLFLKYSTRPTLQFVSINRRTKCYSDEITNSACRLIKLTLSIHSCGGETPIIINNNNILSVVFSHGTTTKRTHAAGATVYPSSVPFLPSSSLCRRSVDYVCDSLTAAFIERENKDSGRPVAVTICSTTLSSLSIQVDGAERTGSP